MRIRTSNTTMILLAGLIAIALGMRTASANDLKISQMEQDIRELQRVVQQQTRRIESLESAARSPRTDGAPRSLTSSPAASNSAYPWLKIESWDKLRVGAPASDALSALGPPTTTRKSQTGEQTLFYTLELDGGGFLSGQVVVASGRIVEVHKPTLK